MRLKHLHILILLPLILIGCGTEGVGGDASNGQALYNQATIGANNAPGCIACHSLEEGIVKVGPSHFNLAVKASDIIASPDYTGSAETVEDFLRESIINPDLYVEEGLIPGLMYQFYGNQLSKEEISDLVAFLLTLK